MDNTTIVANACRHAGKPERRAQSRSWTSSQAAESGLTTPLNAVLRGGFLTCFAELQTELSGGGAAFEPPAHAAFTDDGFCKMPGLQWLSLLEDAAHRLGRPDFGLRLAARETSQNDDNPFTLAICNAETVGDALQYCVRMSRTFRPIFQVDLRLPPYGPWAAIQCETRSGQASRSPQAVEYVLATIYRRLATVSENETKLEIRFTHAPLSPDIVYRSYFGTRVLFNQMQNAILIHRKDLATPVRARSPWIFKLADSYIQQRYPDLGESWLSRSTHLAGRLLQQGRCSLDALASEMGQHPRTLQRRLRDEGASFNALKQEAQRQAALRYLADSSAPLTEIPAKIGLAQGSAFARRCQKWFSMSPRQVRARLSRGVFSEFDEAAV